ncbi:MAG: D-alanyl-D-alanine carboxypeptidase [Lachnospiraceae bacterium]|nr:D-alanyl-D-alanine carboxypeptidase [Lachnospiraceae bacterium]
MRRTQLLSIFLMLALTAAGIFFYMRQYPVQEPEQTALFPEKEIVIPASASAPPALTLHARYAGVMDASSGRMLYGKEMDKKAAMASTTKIMTALLVLESGRIGETVTASSYAASMPKVHLGMVKGRQYRMKDLLYSLMLESHNDTAVAIAEHMAGSVENFAGKMNEKAKALGMTSTHFVTPNGLDAKDHGSTPADMCRLAAYAIQNREFCSLIQTRAHRFSDVSGAHSYSLTNRDAFLSYYDGALGIKTGFTGDAGYCFVGAARRNGITLTSCVLASGWPPNKSYKWTDTRSLMDYGFSHYTAFTFPMQQMSAVRIPVEDGKTDFVSCSQPSAPSTLLGRHETVTVRYNLPDKLYAPVRSHTAIGTVSFYINNSLYRTEKIFPLENIEKSGFSDTIKTVLHSWLETFTGGL